MSAVIATVATIVGVVISGVGAGMSFNQASKAKDARIKADRVAKEKMSEAMKRLDVNYMEALSVPMEAFEQQREQIGQISANVLEAAKEGDQRGVGATAGQVLAGSQAMTDAQRAEMEKTIFNLDAATAEESSRLRDVKTQINLEEAAGAQAAAAEASAMRSASMQQGFQQVGNAVQQGIGAADLYSKGGATRAVNKQMKTNPDFKSQVAGLDTANQGMNVPSGEFNAAGQPIMRNIQIADMSPLQFNDYMTNNFTKQDIRGMFPTGK